MDKAHGPASHAPKRARKLLAHKRQIAKLFDQTSAGGSGGVTLIPLTMYFVRGMV